MSSSPNVPSPALPSGQAPSPVRSVIVEADGGSRGNPGPAGYGAVVVDAVSGAVLAERSEGIGTQTNNVAEYRGLIAGLRAAAELGASTVAVRMDSKLVVEQMKGTWQVKHPALRELAHAAAQLTATFATITFQWIPRAQNARADRLANEAMDRATGKPPRGPARAAGDPASGATAASPRSWAPPTGAPTRLILVRHGSTEHSGKHLLSGRNDLALDAAGRAQAQALATALATGEHGTIARLVASPMPRAQQTAAPIAAALGTQVRTSADFAEMDFGDWEGLAFTDVRERDPELAQAWLDGADVTPPGGESFAAVATRVRRGREALLSEAAGEAVVVVTHVTPIKTVVRLALDAPVTAMFTLHLDIASVSIVDYYPSGQSSVRLVNDTAHLRHC